MRRSAVVAVLLVVAAACSGSGAGDQVVSAPTSDGSASTLPPSIVLPVALPEHGMAVQRGTETVVLTDAAGAVLHELALHYVDDRSTPGSIYLWRTGEVSGGRALRLDPAAHALDPIVVREPAPVSVPAPVSGDGEWRWLAPAPDGSAVELGQWDGQGGGPGAWFVEGGVVRPVVPDVASTALGWLPDGRAAVALPNGVHAVGVDGAATFLTEGVGGMTWGS